MNEDHTCERCRREKPAMNNEMKTALCAEQLRALDRLWPNRIHESNWLQAVLCALGLHRWHKVQLPDVTAGAIIPKTPVEKSPAL